MNRFSNRRLVHEQLHIQNPARVLRPAALPAGISKRPEPLQKEGHLAGKDPEEMVSLVHALKIGHTFLHITRMGKPLTIETILALMG